MGVEVGSKSKLLQNLQQHSTMIGFILTSWDWLLFFLQSTKMNELYKMKQIASLMGNWFLKHLFNSKTLKCYL